MILVAITGPDAAHFATWYAETWRHADGSAVVSPFLSDFGAPVDDWREATQVLVDIYAPLVVLAPHSDDHGSQQDEWKAVCAWAVETGAAILALVLFPDIDRTEVALRIEAATRRGRA